MAKTPKQENDQHTKERAAEAVRTATALIDNWEKGTRARFRQIGEYEENYLGKVRPRISGRSNFPVPVLGRYLDEMRSRLDETPNLKFDSQVSISRKLIARKASAIIHDLKKPSKGNWNKYDRVSRRHAQFAGYNAVDFYSETEDGQFKLNFSPMHHSEFVFELGGGNDLEKHMGVGRFPIWRTKGQLEARAKSGLYSEDQVRQLTSRYGASDFRKHNDFFVTRTQHLKALGIDIDNNSYVGQPIYPLAQIQLTMDDGERFLLTFDYWSGIWVRFVPLKEVFPSGMYSIDFWQTDEDEEVMCKSPCDDIFPLAEGIRVKVNQLFDNHTKRIYGQRGYDPNFVPDPTALIWKAADQLTKMKSYNGKPISQGIYEFKTEDMTGSTISFMDWMDKFLVSVVGINPNDVSEEVQKVGIMFGQLQKTAARLGSQNKSFMEMWQRLGYRALWEMREFLTEPQAVRMIGTRGVEWDSFVGEELDDPADFDIMAEGSNVELEMSEARKKHQGEAMDMVIKDPDFKKELNPRAAVEFILKHKGQFSEEEANKIMDKEHYGNEDMISRADLACEEIVKHISTIREEMPMIHRKTGEVVDATHEEAIPIWTSEMKPKLYPGADLAFVEYINEFAGRLDDDEHDKKQALLAYARAHRKIIVRNMASKAVNELSKKGVGPENIKMPMPPGIGMPPGGGPGGGTPPAPPGPRAPSPDVHARVQKRGPASLGHMPMPTPQLPAGRMPTPAPAIPAAAAGPAIPTPPGA
ncbi:MAG: hypothetical protein KGI03_00885 [Patescibacteria group bacterium]|nr:hypothetical protein [Patescibacteria group bacterium]